MITYYSSLWPAVAVGVRAVPVPCGGHALQPVVEQRADGRDAEGDGEDDHGPVRGADRARREVEDEDSGLAQLPPEVRLRVSEQVEHVGQVREQQQRSTVENIFIVTVTA